VAGNPSVSFGRVVVAPDHRRLGLGKEIVGRVLTRLSEGYCSEIVIEAQLYLEGFYAQFGFGRDGEPYVDLGVPHIKMRLRPGNTPSPAIP
jgi:predicted GNAT family N-acyltransferase